jgi:hypothetical protein
LRLGLAVEPAKLIPAAGGSAASNASLMVKQAFSSRPVAGIALMVAVLGTGSPCAQSNAVEEAFEPMRLLAEGSLERM